MDKTRDATGVLFLDRVTPVIDALFGRFHLAEPFPGSGSVFIARYAGDTGLLWNDVKESLRQLAERLGVALPVLADDGSPAMEDILQSLAGYFGVGSDETLNQIIGDCLFDGAADFETLFQIATRFDDGHGLSTIQIEGCWRCNQSHPWEERFGGEATFINREVSLNRSSSRSLVLGIGLGEMLRTNEVRKASRLLFREIRSLLGCVRDEALRARLSRRVGKALLKSSRAS